MKLDSLYTADIHEEGSEIRIRDDAGKLTSLYIKVKGIDSITYRRELKLQKKKYFEAEQRGSEIDADEFVVDALVACTIGWRGTDEEYSETLCRELYSKAPYVKEQVDGFMAEKKNFTKPKSKK